MAKKKIIVIGAGISGLSAGIHALLKGFDVEIFESHATAGGECTSWRRKGFEIDGCIHWLTGSKKGTPVYKVWELCGALSDDVETYNEECISTFVDTDGSVYNLYSDLERLEAELLRISPEDRREIKRMVGTIKAYQKINPPSFKPDELMSIWDNIKFVAPFITNARRLLYPINKQVYDYIDRFKSPIVRNLLSSTMATNISASALFYMFGLRTRGDGGVVMGGSMQFSQRMQSRFESLGGTIRFNSRVEDILVEDGKAVGIRLAKTGEERRADYIIPAVDIHILLRQFLDNRYHVPFFEKRYENLEKFTLTTSVLVAFGVKADISHLPATVYFKAQSPVRIGVKDYDYLRAKHFDYDPQFSNENGTLVEMLISSADTREYDFWQTLRDKSEAEYRAEKSRIGNRLLAEFETLYPELQGKIELLDVATPLTFNRYCGAYKGSFMGFGMVPGNRAEVHSGRIDGIDNLYVAGQWLRPSGGLPIALLCGRFAVQRICHKEGIDIVFKD